MASSFSGKTIVITGAGGDFGAAGSEFFAHRGANIVMLDINMEALENALKRVTKAVPEAKAIVVKCNVTVPEEIDAAVVRAVEAFGNIDMLWNNAGYQGLMKPALDYPVDDFKRVMDINVTGLFAVLRAVGNAMKSSGGSIVNTASVAGLRGTPTMCAYVASKAAVIGLTVSAAKDLAPYNIRVNAVSPALIGPGFMWDRQNELQAASGSPYYPTDPNELAAKKIASVPLKRLGTVEEVLKSVAFLLSDEASYTTGTNLVVAGGLA